MATTASRRAVCMPRPSRGSAARESVSRSAFSTSGRSMMGSRSAGSCPERAAGSPTRPPPFILPAGSTVWYHDLNGHYEGTHTRKDIAEVQAGEWASPPLTFKLPDGGGYASITEAAVIDYAGMALQADGQRGFRARLGHAQPPNHPFTLRYGDAEAVRLAQPAAIEGRITSPWRLVLIGADLNTLVKDRESTRLNSSHTVLSR